MTNGLILLVFIAALVTFFVVRARHRMGLGVTGRSWVISMTVVIIGLLMLWVYQTQH